ncbi:exopolyphosphatase [Alcaligenaceae bacterium]|nr:exopolyphosphatase [Alcaligenaceae bacterium]
MDYLLAAIDLGSNSFRLSVGRVVQQDGIAQIYATDRMKEHVSLAAGLNEDLIIGEETQQRAIVVLKRFHERLEGFHPNRVRAVATNTFRVARNAAEFLQRAEEALGFPIEVIAGQEEARLIFSGITHELPPSHHQRLMIDIGGGSTEVIIGKDFKPMRMASLFMGCVSYTRRYFPDGVVTEDRMQSAQLAARRELERISWQYRKTGWLEVYGSSGTAKGLLAILQETGMSNKGITMDGMQKLKAKLVQDGRVILNELPGLKPDRALVLPGGLAIMMAIFQELKIKLMLPGEGALRMGVLYDLLGRDSHHDKRDETVRQFIKRYGADLRQCARVKSTAQAFFAQLALGDSAEQQELARTLSWAADLHEIGISIAHNHYHRHTAYILEHADMPGFSRDDQELLALFALGHQGKLGKLKILGPSRAKWLTLLCLRLAVLLSRRRQDLDTLPIALCANGNTIYLEMRKDWLHSHPLSEYALEREKSEWEKAGFEFEVKTS